MTNEEKGRELLRVTTQIAQAKAGSLCTILGAPDQEYGELVGTGTYLRVGSRIYIVTARHVAEEALRKYPRCAHSRGDGLVPVVIRQPFIAHSDLNVDLALLEVNPEDITSTPVRPCESDVLAENSTDLNDMIVVHGFPGIRSRFSPIATAVVSNSQPYGTFEGVLRIPPFDPALHFAVEYPGEGQEDANGRPATLPDPSGMSGTAVWRAGRIAAASGAAWSPDNARIVGIVHTWDQQNATLVATRVEVLREFIRQVEAGAGQTAA